MRRGLLGLAARDVPSKEKEEGRERRRKQWEREGSCLLACFRKRGFLLLFMAKMTMEEREIHMLKQYSHIYLPYTHWIISKFFKRV